MIHKYIFLFLVVFVPQVSIAQVEPKLTNEQVKIKELELQIENLHTLINANKENNNLLIQNANRSIDYVNGLIIFLSVLIAIATALGSFLAYSIKTRLADLSKTNLEMQNKIKFQKLLTEARFFIISGQRYEAEKRAVEMRQLKPDAMHGYFFQGAYLKTLGEYQGAYDAMKTAGDKLGVPSLQIEFNLACYASLDRNANMAIKHLRVVASINKDYLKKKKGDKDLDNIRNDPRFKEIEDHL